MTNIFSLLRYTIALFAACSLILGSSALANADSNAPFQLACTQHEGSKDFVRKAELYCLQSGTARSCEKRAKEFFQGCKFEGSYQKIARTVNKEFLLMFVLAKVPSVTKGSGTQRRAL